MAVAIGCCVRAFREPVAKRANGFAHSQTFGGKDETVLDPTLENSHLLAPPYQDLVTPARTGSS